jgi:5-methylcytosine-specific restriction enzyme A
MVMSIYAKTDKRSAESLGYRHLYDTEQWKRLRIQCFIRDNYTCKRTGEVLAGKHPAPNSPVANHIKPHRGDLALFFNLDNLECIAKAVHDSLVQREEKLGKRIGCDAEGWPLDGGG